MAKNYSNCQVNMLYQFMPNDSICSTIQKQLASMEWKCPWVLLSALQKFKFAVPFLVLVALPACSGKPETPSVGKKTTDVTTATVEASSNDSDLDFFTEKYLSPEERLSRRQSRIEAVLAAP